MNIESKTSREEYCQIREQLEATLLEQIDSRSEIREAYQVMRTFHANIIASYK